MGEVRTMVVLTSVRRIISWGPRCHEPPRGEERSGSVQADLHHRRTGGRRASATADLIAPQRWPVKPGGKASRVPTRRGVEDAEGRRFADLRDAALGLPRTIRPGQPDA